MSGPDRRHAARVAAYRHRLLDGIRGDTRLEEFLVEWIAGR